MRICASACFHTWHQECGQPWVLPQACHPSMQQHARGWSRGSAAGLKLGELHTDPVSKQPKTLPCQWLQSLSLVRFAENTERDREVSLTPHGRAFSLKCFPSFYGKYRLAQSPLLILWLHSIAPRQGHIKMDRFSARGLVQQQMFQLLKKPTVLHCSS